MSNPFLPTTTGGRAGEFAYNDLLRERDYDAETIAGLNGVIPPGNPDAPYKTTYDYEAEFQEKVDNYIVTLEATDQYALGLLNIINNKKQEIVGIMSDVFDSINNIGAGYPTGDEILISDPALVNDSDAEKVVYMAGISTFIYPDGCLPAGTVGVNSCLLGVRGEIYPDIIAAWHYPKVENLDTDTDFYREGESYVKVTNSNLGIGVTAYEFGDAAGSTGTIGLVNSGSRLGYYYFWADLDAVNSGAASSITSLVTDIESLRTEINDYFVGVTTGTNKIRAFKGLYQLDLWYEKKGQRSSTIYDYQGALNTLEGNSQTIQDYDA